MANVVTTAGKTIIAKRMFDSSAQAEPKYVAWGTGSGTAVVGDTALVTEAAESRVSGTSSLSGTNIHRVIGQMVASAGRVITEAGLFDASSSGNLYVRSDFAAINLNTGDSITFTFNIQFT